MKMETGRTSGAVDGSNSRDTARDAVSLLLACGIAPNEAVRLLRNYGTAASMIDIALARGLADETAMLRALASMIGATCSDAPPAPRDGGDPATIIAARRYISPEGPVHVLAPDGHMMLSLLRLKGAEAGRSLVLTPRQTLIKRVFSTFPDTIADLINTTTPPQFSARAEGSAPGLGQIAKRAAPVLAAMAGVFGLLFLVDPLAAIVLPPMLLAPLFMIAAIAVLAGLVESFDHHAEPAALADADLPRYTALVPLFHEANILADLVIRLSAIDYPREKLEILLLVEDDDHETREQLAITALPAFMQVVVVPPGQPRTKPRALNAGMLVATGELVVVFDAEDAPEPDQLRRAAAIFAAMPAEIACVQARLAISNARDGLLTHRFAIDYAALFDCTKAGMARLGWAVPLGGSSNHFRAEALRTVGGWDAWNVTEDADLGIRLARRGLSVQDLPSTTWEEAPNRLSSWMNQRTRWMKGWMQTMMVHARNPAVLALDLGFFRAVIVASMGLAVVLGALLFPLFMAGIVWRLMHGAPLGTGPTLTLLADAVIVECIALALLAEVLPAFVALRRRGALALAPWILLAPLTYLMTSFAAWRALFDLAIRPHHWHKTRHGEARRGGGLSALARSP